MYDLNELIIKIQDATINDYEFEKDNLLNLNSISDEFANISFTISDDLLNSVILNISQDAYEEDMEQANKDIKKICFYAILTNQQFNKILDKSTSYCGYLVNNQNLTFDQIQKMIDIKWGYRSEIIKKCKLTYDQFIFFLTKYYEDLSINPNLTNEQSDMLINYIASRQAVNDNDEDGIETDEDEIHIESVIERSKLSNEQFNKYLPIYPKNLIENPNLTKVQLDRVIEELTPNNSIKELDHDFLEQISLNSNLYGEDLDFIIDQAIDSRNYRILANICNNQKLNNEQFDKILEAILITTEFYDSNLFSDLSENKFLNQYQIYELLKKINYFDKQNPYVKLYNNPVMKNYDWSKSNIIQLRKLHKTSTANLLFPVINRFYKLSSYV